MMASVDYARGNRNAIKATHESALECTLPGSARVLLLERVTRNSSLRTDCPSHHLMTWGDVLCSVAPNMMPDGAWNRKYRHIRSLSKWKTPRPSTKMRLVFHFTALAREIERRNDGRPIHQTRAYYRSQRTEYRYAASPAAYRRTCPATWHGCKAGLQRLHRQAGTTRSRTGAPGWPRATSLFSADSDTTVERGWLSALLKPLEDPKTICGERLHLSRL